jgi:hypothetical protein
MIEPQSSCTQTAYILATGASVLNLSDQEKSFLNQHPYTLAMNRYLLYYERVGVLPKDLFLYDFSPEVFPLFVETIKKANRLIPEANYYVHKMYKKFFRRTPRGFAGELIRRYEYWRKFGYWMPVSLPRLRLVGIEAQKIPHPEEGEFYWGNSLDQPLLHYRGSLTTAINLASIVYPVKEIKLIGVDLNTRDSIDKGEYEEKLSKPLNAITKKDVFKKAEDLGYHSTVLPTQFEQGISFIIPKIRAYLLGCGIELACCNPVSYLVEENLCPFRPVIES